MPSWPGGLSLFTLRTVSESPEQIRKHIAALTEFELKYTEYLAADRESRTKGSLHYSAREWRERDREIRKLAPRADAAIEASGVGGLALYGPPAVGSPFIADDLASLIFHVKPSVFGDEAPDDHLRQDIADRLPTQIAGLEMALEEAEEREAGGKLRLSGRAWPTLAGRIRHVPPVLGFIADVGGVVVVGAFVGRFFGVW
jgi:hypothetical protein